jgi:ribosomal protein L37E
MDVLCRTCGNIQKWNPDYPYCSKCGSPISEKDREVSINLRAGKDKQAIGIGIIALSIVIFHYFARYEGSLLAGIGLLLWIWGKIINNREKKKGKISEISS